jgi:hypothetical protein
LGSYDKIKRSKVQQNPFNIRPRAYRLYGKNALAI